MNKKFTFGKWIENAKKSIFSVAALHCRTNCAGDAQSWRDRTKSVLLQKWAWKYKNLVEWWLCRESICARWHAPCAKANWWRLLQSLFWRVSLCFRAVQCAARQSWFCGKLYATNWTRPGAKKCLCFQTHKLWTGFSRRTKCGGRAITGSASITTNESVRAWKSWCSALQCTFRR